METVYLHPKECYTYSDGQRYAISEQMAMKMLRQGAKLVVVPDRIGPVPDERDGHTYAVCMLRKHSNDKNYICQWHTERK